MKQKIEIEVPEGKVAVWDEKKQKIIFERESWRDIKTFKDVLKYLNISEKEFEIAQNSRIPVNKWQLIVEAFIKASNDQCRLTEGDVYFPYCYIVYNNEYKFYKTDIKARSCIINNKECTLIGGRAYHISHAGLGLSYSSAAAADSSVRFGFRGFSSREVAKHISTYFTFELFEATVGWRTNEIQWL